MRVRIKDCEKYKNSNLSALDFVCDQRVDAYDVDAILGFTTGDDCLVETR